MAEFFISLHLLQSSSSSLLQSSFLLILLLLGAEIRIVWFRLEGDEDYQLC